MKSLSTAPIAAAIALSLLGACSKPATPVADTANAANTATANAADATANAASGGGVVSPPQSNGAVNTDANKTSADVASASNSFTQGQAKGHIENAGYTDVGNLVKTPDGMWTATAKMSGKPVSVTVDFKGAVTAK
ncbi:MAG TPA: hypothetical protein VNW53_13100 [Phenylobacterium sp.]|jgi:protein CpxP|uniref:hypothetical protein n=1 Tax=Phenylobacterium sp. TaxID=1871053 RepID=UPI002C21C073|nr:hypothetical protein [Phenylobacterium sp.]HXA39930.1 hypothetical protein [Phenylobacterium sp.]